MGEPNIYGKEFLKDFKAPLTIFSSSLQKDLEKVFPPEGSVNILYVDLLPTSETTEQCKTDILALLQFLLHRVIMPP